MSSSNQSIRQYKALALDLPVNKLEIFIMDSLQITFSFWLFINCIFTYSFSFIFKTNYPHHMDLLTQYGVIMSKINLLKWSNKIHLYCNNLYKKQKMKEVKMDGATKKWYRWSLHNTSLKSINSILLHPSPLAPSIFKFSFFLKNTTQNTFTHIHMHMKM